MASNLIKDPKTRVKAVKTLGFVGSLIAGITACVAGDYVTGLGVIASSLSSAGILHAG